jgi:hypothetical protein
MHPKIDILLDSVVKAIWFPCICEEHEGDGLTKVIELETAGSDGVHDGGVVDDAGGDFQCPSSKDDICMCSCTIKMREGFNIKKRSRTRKDPLQRARRHLLYRHYAVFRRSLFRPFRDRLGLRVFHRKLPI